MTRPTIACKRLLPLMLGLATAAFAQEDLFDPAAGEMSGDRGSSWYGDFLLRGDHVTGMPMGMGMGPGMGPGMGMKDEVRRVRGRLRTGLAWWPGDNLEAGAAIKLALGSDDNADNRSNNDNERSDAVTWDRLYLRWHLGTGTRVTLGKDDFPLDLSNMLWDDDLRPAGLAIEHEREAGGFDRLTLVAGYWAGQHLYGDDSRIAALQGGWHLREGTRLGGSILLGLIDFDRLETLTRQGLTRENRQVDGRLASDYRLVDLQLIGRARLGGLPLRVGVDLARNLEADDARDAARLDIRLGDAGRAGGWEAGYAVQRIQSQAAMAAFNDDDWWFHAAARGHLLWLGYGLDGRWSLRLSGFRETRDGVGRDTDRILLDLNFRW